MWIYFSTCVHQANTEQRRAASQLISISEYLTIQSYNFFTAQKSINHQSYYSKSFRAVECDHKTETHSGEIPSNNKKRKYNDDKYVYPALYSGFNRSKRINIFNMPKWTWPLLFHSAVLLTLSLLVPFYFSPLSHFILRFLRVEVLFILLTFNL